MLLLSEETIKKNRLTEEMPASKFISEYCYACGGNCGAMLLTGIKKLFPAVYDEIPETLGKDGVDAFVNLCETLQALNVNGEK